MVIDNPGVEPTSPVADQPAAGDTQPPAAPEGPQPASEGVKPPESKPEQQHVPYERFQEVNNKAKDADKRAEEAERRLAELEANQPKTDDPEPSLDPDAEKTLASWARKQGFVTKEELDAEKVRLQVDADVRELKGEFGDFDKDKVLAYAEEQGLQITNKAGLKTAYQLMTNSDPKVAEEAIRNKLLAELKESGQLIGSDAERPGAGSAKITQPEQTQGIRGRIAAAVAKHRSA